MDEKDTKKLKPIPLSNNNIQRRISDKGEDIRTQVGESFRKYTNFSLQIDESRYFSVQFVEHA